MRKVFCILLIVATSTTTLSETKWSKEIPGPDTPVTRERRQFNVGDWIPLTQPCITCRPLTDPADAGRRHEDIGLTPPRPPTVTRQIHKSAFFPQDESSILSVPPPPVFNRNQITNTNARFPNFLQQFNSPNSLQFETQSVFPQAQFLSQPFLSSTSLLGSNYPQVLPLLNNPSALLVQGNLNSPQDIKTQKINQEPKVPNLQENVILEQNRQQHHLVKNQQVAGAPVSGLQVPLTNPPAEFAPNRQQQNILEGNILTPPPIPNSTFPDIIIPGLDKEEIQLLYVPLETLKQRAHQQEVQQQQHKVQQQQLQLQQQQHQAQQQQHQVQHQQHQVQHQQHQVQHQQHQVQQQQQQHQVQQQHQTQKQQQIQQHQVQQQNQIQLQQQFHQQNVQKQQRVTPLTPNIKFTQQQQTFRPTELPTTSPPAGHFITHSATPTPHTIGTTFHQVPVTPTTLFFQHLPFQQSQSPIISSTPETPTLQSFITPTPLNENFSPFPSVTPVENLVTAPEKLQFTPEFVTTPKAIPDQISGKDSFGKEISFDKGQHIGKFKSISIQQQEEQQKQFLLEQQKEQERLKLQEQKLLQEQQERERARQEKLLREQQEWERQQKLLREQQEQKLIKEQEERERQKKILLEQQERERQHKILLEQRERERQQKILREQQERERQEKILREQQERERQQKLYRERQERERQQKILREQQERERQRKLLLEQQERERQEKVLLEQRERKRQQELLLEQQERERQEKLLRDQQERERQEKLLREQQERELQEKLLREEQERELQQQQLLFEQQERERQEKILIEERRQKDLLLKQQQEREQQLLLQEQQDRQRQLLLNQEQQYLIQQQQLSQPLPTQFDLQNSGEPTRPPQFEAQTEEPDEALVPHQPPLSVFYGGSKGQPRIADVLKELRGAKTISVLDQYLENIPKVFVGPASLRPPKGYGKFELPYLSNIDVNRVERKVERLPFFVAPLNFLPPVGYSKIPFPAPHVGSVVIDSESIVRQPERGSTASPIFSTLHPRLRSTTQVPLTTHIQQIHPKQKIKETRFPNQLLPNPEQINELKTEAIITTTVTPETTTQARGRRPYYRTKARRPTTISSLQATRHPETNENTQFQKTETVERKPNVKFPKQRRHRVKTTTEEYDSVNSANRQYLIETSPTPATQKHFDNEEYPKEFFQPDNTKTEVQGLFEVSTVKVEHSSSEATGITASTQNPLTTAGVEVIDKGGFSVTTQRPSTIARFEPTSRASDYDKFGQTDIFATTQRVPSTVEIENVGITGFYDHTPSIPVGIESNGDSGFFNKHAFGSPERDNTFFTTGQTVDKEISGFSKFENVYFNEGPTSLDNVRLYEQEQQQTVENKKGAQFEQEQQNANGEIPSTPKTVFYETNYQNTEQSTEAIKTTTPRTTQKVNEEQDINLHYVEIQKENEEIPQTTTQEPTTPRIKSRFRTKSRGQVNFANSQTSTQSPFVRKRVVYKTRKEEPYVSEEAKPAPKFRGHRKNYQTSTESSPEYDGTKTLYTVKPLRRSSVPVVYRRRKPVTPVPETTLPSYASNHGFEYSPSGVSNDVFEDQIRESSLSRSQYAENAVSFTATTTTTTTPYPEDLFTRRRDDVSEEQKTEEIQTENYPPNFPSEVYVSDITRVTPVARTTQRSTVEEEDSKKFQDGKKAFDPSLEKKNARRRIRVRVHKRPHEQIETAESQNFGTVANVLIPPTPAKPSVEPDLYRFSKTGFNFDQSDKFAGTKNQAYVRNITSDILENTAAFSAPGVENETDAKKVTIASEDKAPAETTTELAPEPTERTLKDEEEEPIADTTTETAPVETTTYFTTVESSESDTEEPSTVTTTEEDTSKEVHTSTATEISHETEICFRGKCIKTNSATADDDLRKLVQSADKILIT